MRKKKTRSQDPFLERETLKYEKPIASREYILEHLQKQKKSFIELAQSLKLKTEEERIALRRRLRAMVRDQQLICKNKKFSFYVKHLILEGTLSFDAEQNLWCKVGEELLLIPQFNINFVKEGMLAQILVIDEQKDPKFAKILEIVSDDIKNVVGRLTIAHGNCYVIPYNREITQDLLIPQEYLNQAKDKDIVMVKVVPTYSKKWQVVGEIIKVVGNDLTPSIEVITEIALHNLPHIWNEGINNALADLKEPDPQKLKQRALYQDLPFVTIDGEDAKDFDDAVYCETKGPGFVLYVAIADVSFFVHKNSKLDREALKRGNSVYFPNYVIPMLPEKLSNDLCSLKPNISRLVFICEMHIDRNGKIARYKFYEGIIKSQARLTYALVSDLLEKEVVDKKYKQLLPHLENLHAVYKSLFKARQKRGALDFESIETTIVFDKDRKVQDVVAKKRNIAHRIIEECMLAANTTTAKFLLKQGALGMYRIHETPQLDKLTTLKLFLEQLGLQLPKNADHPLAYTELLQRIKHRPDYTIIQTFILRSMCQATYSHNNIGHFGLAYDAYTHFTSPIRRYPDLLVHRILKNILNNKKNVPVLSKEYTLESAACHCSITERRADDASRDIEKWFKCQFMCQHIGKTFNGVISGMNKFGFFVQLEEIFVEGLVHVTNLAGDYFVYDPIRQILYGERTRVIYAIGQKVTVEIMQVDPDRRRIDFRLLVNHALKTKKTKRTKKKKQ